MKTYKQLIEDNIKWLVPDYPEQILSKDDPEGNWVTEILRSLLILSLK